MKLENKNMIWLLAIFLSFFLWGSPGHATAQGDSKVVQTIGTGTIHGNDITSARKEALSSAMVSSVQQALTEFIPFETIVSDFKQLDNLLFSNIEDYISEYKVLSENTTGTTHRSLVEIDVFMEKIKKKLIAMGVISTKAKLPKVVFFIAEQSIGDILPLFWWGEEPTFVKGHSEASMAKAFTQEGFSVFDHKGLMLDHPALENELKASGFNNPYLNNDQAIQLGRYLKVDMVILGTAMVTSVANMMGESTRSYRAELFTRAIDLETGKEIASVNQQAIAAGTDNSVGGIKALSQAGTKAGQELVSQIAHFQQKTDAASGQIEIRVKGSSNLSTFVNFRKNLSEIPHVRNVRIKETLPDQAVLLINYDRPIQELAEILAQRSFDNFGINIYEVNQNYISIELLSSANSP